MRILHVIASVAPRYGGPSAVIRPMCRELASRGHEVLVVTTNDDGGQRLGVPIGAPVASDGFSITYLPAGWPPQYRVSPRLAVTLRRLVPQFDVVHVHSLFLFSTLAATFISRQRRVPYVVRPHGTLDPYHRARHRIRKMLYWRLVERRMIESAGGVHYTSDAERHAAEDAGVTAAGYVVPLGVDIPDDSRHETGRAEGLTVDGGQVTFIGRLTAKKNLDVLIDSFHRVACQVPRAHLVIAGPDDEGIGPRLLAQVRDLGLGDRVTLPGLVVGDAKTRLLRSSSVFVLPSADENFGVSVAEAMAAAIPVIVSPGVALHGEVERAGAGLVSAADPELLAPAMLRLLTNPDLAKTLGANGRSLVQSRFSWSFVGAQLEDMYRSVISAAN